MKHRTAMRAAIFVFLMWTVLLGTGCLSPGAPAPTETAEEMPTATPTPQPTPEPSLEPLPITLVLGTEGEEVLQMQQRLAELEYLVSEAVTGRFDELTRAAVEAFQEQNGLEVTGEAPEAALEVLYSQNAAPYDHFEDLAPTIQMEFAELVGDNGNYDLPKGYPAAGTYKIIVDIAHQVTMVYRQDEQGEYTVPVRYMLCSTGTGSRTPMGTFKMGAYRVRFSQFARDKRYGQYWTQIRGAIYFHTILYTRKDAASYQEDIFEKLGTKDSHGCVRLTVPDARWMFYHIAPGTVCEIRVGSEGDEQTAAIRKKLVLAQPPEEHLDLRAGEIPDTDNWRIEDVPLETPFVQGTQH